MRLLEGGGLLVDAADVLDVILEVLCLEAKVELKRDEAARVIEVGVICFIGPETERALAVAPFGFEILGRAEDCCLPCLVEPEPADDAEVALR